MPNINKNIIMQAGAAVANATNKAAGLSAATPEPGSIISAIQLVNGGRKIGPAALAHFTESVRNKLLSLLVDMEPIQDLHGYSHPWPAGGGVNKFDASVTTFKKWQLVSNAFEPKTDGFEFISFSVSGDNITLTTQKTYMGICFAVDAVDYDRKASLNGTISGGKAISFYDGYTSGATRISNGATSCSIPANTSGYVSIRLDSAQTCIINFQIEQGSTASSWTPYSNICPISGRTGLSVYVGPTSAIGDATADSMDWTTPAGTIYAGSADIVSGDTKAAPYYASYNGETLVGPWISSMDVYDPDGTPTTGAQVVDLGGTMTEYHITGQDIITLVGDNYIWSDSGDVTITE